MSNRKKAKSPKPTSLIDHVILTERNKFVVAAQLGYSVELVDNILAKAKRQGYEKVRLPTSIRG
jgi:hypothetical protein